MRLKLMMIAVSALAWPIEMAPQEVFQKELRVLKMKIDNLESNEENMKETMITMKNEILDMKKNEKNMKENMVKLRNEISDMKKNECGMEKKLVNLDTGKENTNKDEEVKSRKNESLGKIKNGVDQNVIDANISDHEYQHDCCDILTGKVNDLNTTVTHINERLNDNTIKIIENQLEIQNNKKEIDNHSKYFGDMMKRSDYCAYRWKVEENEKNQVITYDTMVLENNYNISGAEMDVDKGEFTAGLSAIYQINVYARMIINDHNSAASIYLRRNGVQVREFVMYYQATGVLHDDVGGKYIMLKLDAGDTVSVFAEGLSGVLYDVTFCINVLK